MDLEKVVSRKVRSADSWSHREKWMEVENGIEMALATLVRCSLVVATLLDTRMQKLAARSQAQVSGTQTGFSSRASDFLTRL